MNVALRRKLFILLIIAAVVLATVYGFLPKAVEVDLADVSRGRLQVTIEEEGRTRLKERFVVTAPVAGYLERIRTKVGDKVAKGQTVATLEPLRSPALDPRSRAEAEAAVKAAEAALAAAGEKESAAAADAAYLGKRMERLGNLYARGSIAKDQYDQIRAENDKAQAAARSAGSAVELARADLQRAKATLQNFSSSGRAAAKDKVHIASPAGGSIFRIYRESEGPVNTGEPLLDVGDVRNLEVRVEVLSSDAVKIKPGTSVYFRRWGGEGPLTGIVRVVEPAGFTKISSLGVEEQRVLVIADITSPPDVWRALGDAYRLEAHFVVWEGKDVLQIPTSALFRFGAEWAVFVEESGKARMRLIKVGERSGLMAEILSGLKEKERVVAHPGDTIRDGSKISPR